MVKCDLCKETVQENFLGKLFGTYIVSGKKKKVICRNCQKQNSVDEIKEKL